MLTYAALDLQVGTGISLRVQGALVALDVNGLWMGARRDAQGIVVRVPRRSGSVVRALHSLNVSQVDWGLDAAGNSAGLPAAAALRTQQDPESLVVTSQTPSISLIGATMDCHQREDNPPLADVQLGVSGTLPWVISGVFSEMN